jgi:hypothetical protein
MENDLLQKINLGTSKVLDTLIQCNFKYNIFLVNLWTIVRNCIDKQENNDIFNKVFQNCESLIQYFTYIEPNDDNLYHDTYILFYIPDTYFIQPGFKQLPTSVLYKTFQYAEELYNILENTFKADQFSNRTLYIEYWKFAWTHTTYKNIAVRLYEKLVSVRDIIGSLDDPYNYIKILMLSNISLDWLLAFESKFADINFIESFTGKINHIQDLSKKLIHPKFKKKFPEIHKYIPFTDITHTLFGDHVIVTGLLSLKQQEQLFNIFIQECKNNLYAWVNEPNLLYESVHKHFDIPLAAISCVNVQGGNIAL